MDEIQIVDAESETGDGSDNGTATGAVAENSDTNPWPRLEEMFTFSSQSSDKKNLLFKCNLCPPSKKAFSATYKTSHSNLRKHCEG